MLREYFTRMKSNSNSTIYHVKVNVEYQLRKTWIKDSVYMTALTTNVFKFMKFPHSMDFIEKKLGGNRKNFRFRIKSIDVINELGKSFYY